MDPIMQFLAEYKTALQDAGRLKAEADYHRDLQEIAYAQAVLEAGDISVAKAEYVAFASEKYRKATDALHTARAAAAEAEKTAEHMAARLDTWRSREASRRLVQQRSGSHGTQETEG